MKSISSLFFLAVRLLFVINLVYEDFHESLHVNRYYNREDKNAWTYTIYTYTIYNYHWVNNTNKKKNNRKLI